MELLLMLEDDLERIERFRSIVAYHHQNAVLTITRNVPAFIAAFSTLERTPDLICLDHDLFTDSPNEPDPGDGRDASAFLINQAIRCPVLIHSSNSMAADSMLYSMREAGWKVNRISPIGDDWIEADWYPVAAKMVAGNGDRDTTE